MLVHIVFVCVCVADGVSGSVGGPRAGEMARGEWGVGGWGWDGMSWENKASDRRS